MMGRPEVNVDIQKSWWALVVVREVQGRSIQAKSDPQRREDKGKLSTLSCYSRAQTQRLIHCTARTAYEMLQ